MDTSNFIIEDTSCFEKFGIKGVNTISFQKNNIVVGENGCGKTRFLKAIRQYHIDCNIDPAYVIYAYFPNLISENDVSNSKKPCPLPLLDFLNGETPMEFEEFVGYMQQEGCSFIEQLYVRVNEHYIKYQATCKKAINTLNQLFPILLGRHMVLRETEIVFQKVGVEDDTVETVNELMKVMSPGEKSLFYLSIFISVISHVYNKHDVYLILDEPELHLHTKALLNFIELVKQSIKYNQLWIATHSYELVSQFCFENLVLIKESKVCKRDSHLYEEIYDSLVGHNDNILDWLSSFESWQYYQFIAECFSLPKVVGAINNSDLQFKQFINAIIRKSNTKVNVLDFGGGKGRIGSCLKASQNSTINYSVYEPYPTEVPEGIKYYTKIQEIKEKFDFVILMNVLHEIDVKKWEDTFAQINALLNDSGCLIFVEVSTLSKGEQPVASNGYLVLSKRQLMRLFKITESSIIEGVLEGEGNSNCYLIKKEYLMNVDLISIFNAIYSLERSAGAILKREYKRRVKDALDEKPCLRNNARKYACYSQLYINAIFAKEELDRLIAEIRAEDYKYLTDHNNVKKNMKTQSPTTSVKASPIKVGEVTLPDKNVPKNKQTTVSRPSTTMKNSNVLTQDEILKALYNGITIELPDD